LQNKVLRKILGPSLLSLDTGENFTTMSFVTCAPHQMFGVIESKRMRWAGHVARVGEKRSAYRILVMKP
jgi:hypothetical protein